MMMLDAALAAATAAAGGDRDGDGGVCSSSGWGREFDATTLAMIAKLCRDALAFTQPRLAVRFVPRVRPSGGDAILAQRLCANREIRMLCMRMVTVANENFVCFTGVISSFHAAIDGYRPGAFLTCKLTLMEVCPQGSYEIWLEG